MINNLQPDDSAEFGPGLPLRSSSQTESFRSEADESPYKDGHENLVTAHLAETAETLVGG